MPKKCCQECGREWGIAKRTCTCGNSFTANKTRRKLNGGHTIQTPKPNPTPKKQCPSCPLKWANNKRQCTCGHSFKKRKRTQKKTGIIYNCVACGKPKKGHICRAQRTRVQEPRAQPTRRNDSKQLEHETEPVESVEPVKSPVQAGCGICSLRQQLVKISAHIQEATNLNKLEELWSKVQSRADSEINSITADVQRARKCVHDKILQLKAKKNVFHLMLASAKSPAPKKKKRHQPTPPRVSRPKSTRSDNIKSALASKQLRLNDDFLARLRNGIVSLQPQKVDSDGKDIRPQIYGHKKTAKRRLEVAKHGILEASKADADGLVWIIRALYSIDGLRRAIDVALLSKMRTVSLSCCTQLETILLTI